jgi:hypothetical protein
MVDGRLGQSRPAVDAVEHVERQLGVSDDVGEPLSVGVGLPATAERVEAVEGEPGVAEPGVAVVPVADPPISSGSDVVPAATTAPVGS